MADAAQENTLKSRFAQLRLTSFSGKLRPTKAMVSVAFKSVVASEVLISMCTISVFTRHYIHIIHTVHPLTVHTIYWLAYTNWLLLFGVLVNQGLFYIQRFPIWSKVEYNLTERMIHLFYVLVSLWLMSVPQCRAEFRRQCSGSLGQCSVPADSHVQLTDMGHEGTA